MAQFLSIHKVPGLDEDAMAENTPEILESTYARFVESLVDFKDGFLASVWEADDRAQVEKELQRLGFPFLELHQVHLRMTRADLEASAASNTGSSPLPTVARAVPDRNDQDARQP
jgi:hypothetical protein